MECVRVFSPRDNDVLIATCVYVMGERLFINFFDVCIVLLNYLGVIL